jgi:hypothetical protein
MRTTLTIDDDILGAARNLAESQGKSLGTVLSELARRGLNRLAPPRQERAFPVFEVSPDAPPLTPEMVQLANEGER